MLIVALIGLIACIVFLGWGLSKEPKDAYRWWVLKDSIVFFAADLLFFIEAISQMI